MLPIEKRIRGCRICVEAPIGDPLPHEPNPVLITSRRAKIAICGQAPGNRVNLSGRPFTDPSGVRLREWLGTDEGQFYDRDRIAIVPMGFCFPGNDRHGGDLPPRRECAATWHEMVFDAMRQIEVILLVGAYAQKWHLRRVKDFPTYRNLTDTVRDWKTIFETTNNRQDIPALFPLPHPSWRNTAWIKKNPWFEKDLLPKLREVIQAKL